MVHGYGVDTRISIRVFLNEWIIWHGHCVDTSTREYLPIIRLLSNIFVKKKNIFILVKLGKSNTRLWSEKNSWEISTSKDFCGGLLCEAS